MKSTLALTGYLLAQNFGGYSDSRWWIIRPPQAFNAIARNSRATMAPLRPPEGAEAHTIHPLPDPNPVLIGI
jgi:hypothetical protein